MVLQESLIDVEEMPEPPKKKRGKTEAASLGELASLEISAEEIAEAQKKATEFVFGVKG